MTQSRCLVGPWPRWIDVVWYSFARAGQLDLLATEYSPVCSYHVVKTILTTYIHPWQTFITSCRCSANLAKRGLCVSRGDLFWSHEASCLCRNLPPCACVSCVVWRLSLAQGTYRTMWRVAGRVVCRARRKQPLPFLRQKQYLCAWNLLKSVVDDPALSSEGLALPTVRRNLLVARLCSRKQNQTGLLAVCACATNPPLPPESWGGAGKQKRSSSSPPV